MAGVGSGAIVVVRGHSKMSGTSWRPLVTDPSD